MVQNEITHSVEERTENNAEQSNIVDCLEVDNLYYFGLSWFVFRAGEEVMSVFLSFENFNVVEHEW